MEKELLQQAKEKVDLFALSTDLECFVINEYGETLYENRGKTACDICKSMDSKKCRDSHLFGAYQAEMYGGTYVFFCPLGLVHFASPIMRQSEVVGALLGGHLLMTPPDNFLFKHLMSMESDESLVKDALRKIPVIPTGKVQALSQLLQVLAEQLSDESIADLQLQREAYTFNRHLSQYIQSLKTQGKNARIHLNYDVQKEKELLHYVSIGNRKKAADLLSQILAETRHLSGKDTDMFRARLVEIIVLLSRTIIENGGEVEEVLGYNYLYLNQLNNFETIDDMLHWTTTVLKRFMDTVFNLNEAKHTHAIHKALYYMNTNYMHKITLVEVSEQVNFTPPYFSKIFKDECKLSFNKYLNKIRIEKSLDLLKEGMHQSEIAYLVGFSDQSHYSRHFKQVMGITPGEFKKKQYKNQ